MRYRRVGGLVCALALLGPINGAAGTEVQQSSGIDDADSESDVLTVEEVNALVGVGDLHDGVDRVAITGNGYEEAAEAFIETANRLAEVERKLDETAVARAGRSTERTAMASDRIRLESESLEAGIETVDKAEAITALAVSAYMATGTASDPGLSIFGEDGLVEGFRRQQLRENATEHQSERLATAEMTTRKLAGQTDELDGAIESNAGAIAELDARADRLLVERIELFVHLVADAEAVRETRLLADVIGVDFPVVALDAYVWAAELAFERTGCGIQWWMIAAVGKTESGHGTAKGSELNADGTTSVKILGLPLDGTSGTALIKDSDNGLLDADTVYDHAVGPMQFIPQTWNRKGVDGNDDDEIDPHNLYDAAATTALYLCQGRSMTTEEDMRAGYFSYNHHDDYVEAVLARAYAYQAINLGV